MIASQTVKDIAPTIAVIAVVVGAAWAILAEIHESHIELLEENAKTRVELLEENAKTRVELLEENAKTRVEIEKLDAKFDNFKDSHEREHDLFYGQGDIENPTPPN